jgi:hypothetical protein
MIHRLGLGYRTNRSLAQAWALSCRSGHQTNRVGRFVYRRGNRDMMCHVIVRRIPVLINATVERFSWTRRNNLLYTQTLQVNHSLDKPLWPEMSLTLSHPPPSPIKTFIHILTIARSITNAVPTRYLQGWLCGTSAVFLFFLHAPNDDSGPMARRC